MPRKEKVIGFDKETLTRTRDMRAFSHDEKLRYGSLINRLFERVQAVEELPDGLELRLLAEDSSILVASEWITLERRCCTFLNFELEVKPGAGSLCLRITGPAGTRKFLKEQARSMSASQ